LTDELYQAIEEWKERLANTLKVVSLTENVGVGAAKNIGIEMCSCELIAVMDESQTIEPYFNIVLNKTISKYLAPGSDTNDIFFKKFVQYI
jgi:glycosyltransferase involved in cell wall biosynthesis